MGAAMGKNYSHLSLEERIEIYHCFENGLSRRSIAQRLGRAVSTISRELRRNARPTKQYVGGYKPDRAHQLAARRRRWDARFKLERQPDLRDLVQQHLAMGWSPQQIAGRLARDKAPMTISHESIYRYVYHRTSAHKDYWHRLLPQRKNRRGRLRRGGLGSVQTIKHRRSIAERPKNVDRRRQAGHWEADLMAFAKYGQYIVTLHERTARLMRIVRLSNKTAAHVARQIARLLADLPGHLRRTITFDNGTEFALHHTLKTKLGVDTFFCDPRAPWQKGGIENAIGRMRRNLPRKTDLATLSRRQIQAITDAYNNTPRKCLGYLTPNEAFSRVALQP